MMSILLSSSVQILKLKISINQQLLLFIDKYHLIPISIRHSVDNGQALRLSFQLLSRERVNQRKRIHQKQITMVQNQWLGLQRYRICSQ